MTSTVQRSALRNRLLAGLPDEDLERLSPMLERLTLQQRQVLFDVDVPIEHVYFPETCVASVVSVMADGSAVETATIGLEGVVGLPVFHGTDRTSSQAFIQVAGDALRMPASGFAQEVQRLGPLTMAVHRYSQALFTLVAQSSACNRLHTLQERCARWMLHTHDRCGSDTFQLTQQFLSQMMGVRRATVTEAMQAVQEAGALRYAMGTITITDRAALERLACECYTIIAREFDRLLGGSHLLSNPYAGFKTQQGGKTRVRDAEPREPTDSIER